MTAEAGLTDVRTETREAGPSPRIAWSLAGAWLAVIAVESTALLSSASTSRFLYPLLTFLFGPIDATTFYFWHGIGRKAGHVVGYAVLSLLLLRAWKASLGAWGEWSWRAAQLAFWISAAVASLDEWHQSHLASRTGTIRDVLLDSAAALALLVLAYGYHRGHGLLSARTKRGAEAEASGAG